MKTSTKLVLAFLATLAIAQPSPAKKARQTEFQKCNQSAQEQFNQGDYKKAESLLEHSLRVVRKCHANDEQLANTLKVLGETFLKEGKYAEAEICFIHAKDIFEALNHPDAELLDDMAMLIQAYKSIDVEALGQFAQELTEEAKVLSVGFLKTDTGDRVEIELSNSFHKVVQNPFIHGIELGRHVRLDLSQQSDGTIQVSDIKGLQIKRKHWVSVTDLTFKPEEDGLHMASISARRMGITRTVTAKLSSRMYQLIAAIAGQVKTRTQAAAHSLAESTGTQANGAETDAQPSPPAAGEAASNTSADAGTGMTPATSPENQQAGRQ